jgi:hypothetical protein
VDASRGLPVQVESWLRNWTFGTSSAAAEDAADLAYVPIGNFNGNPVATFVGEKRLYG